MNHSQYESLIDDYGFLSDEWDIKHTWAPHCQWTSDGSYVSPDASSMTVYFDGFLNALARLANKKSTTIAKLFREFKESKLDYQNNIKNITYRHNLKLRLDGDSKTDFKEEKKVVEK